MQDVVDQIDVRVLLRAPHDVLWQRRHERHGYHTAGEHPLIHLRSVPNPSSFLLPSLYYPNLLLFIRGVQSDQEGELWRDPPNYWEQIVWPAYIEAHKHVFEGGNWESGASSGKIEDLLIIDELEAGMTRAVNQVCEEMKRLVYSK